MTSASRSTWATPSSAIRAAIARTTTSISASCAALRGIAVQWLSPMGLFRLSYAVPLRWQDATRREYGDDIEEIQFSVGKAF